LPLPTSTRRSQSQRILHHSDDHEYMVMQCIKVLEMVLEASRDPNAGKGLPVALDLKVENLIEDLQMALNVGVIE